MSKHVVMYSRTTGCPFITVAKRVFNDHALPYQEVFIDKDMEARHRVQEWTGFLSVPTLIIAEEGSVLPFETPTPLPKGASPRGINRGSMITEGSIEQLEGWLAQHGMITNSNEKSG